MQATSWMKLRFMSIAGGVSWEEVGSVNIYILESLRAAFRVLEASLFQAPCLLMCLIILVLPSAVLRNFFSGGLKVHNKGRDHRAARCFKHRPIQARTRDVSVVMHSW